VQDLPGETGQSFRRLFAIATLAAHLPEVAAVVQAQQVLRRIAAAQLPQRGSGVGERERAVVQSLVQFGNEVGAADAVRIRSETAFRRSCPRSRSNCLASSRSSGGRKVKRAARDDVWWVDLLPVQRVLVAGLIAQLVDELTGESLHFDRVRFAPETVAGKARGVARGGAGQQRRRARRVWRTDRCAAPPAAGRRQRASAPPAPATSRSGFGRRMVD
jgi:hypothetical protein